MSFNNKKSEKMKIRGENARKEKEGFTESFQCDKFLKIH